IFVYPKFPVEFMDFRVPFTSGTISVLVVVFNCGTLTETVMAINVRWMTAGRFRTNRLLTSATRRVWSPWLGAV
ncbi:MAG: hypothetical protein ACP5XB_27320, partial [Isosphaeraceae bacterium]